jgi:ferredoxin
MSDVIERQVGDLTVMIDRSACTGFGHCVEEAREAFRLDADRLADFGTAPHTVGRDDLIYASAVCPVEAITVYDRDGSQLVP